MIRLLPFILIPLLVLGGLGYYRYVVSKPSLPVAVSGDQIEIPITAPQATIEDRVKSLEEIITKLVTQVNSLKSQSTTTQSTSTSGSDTVDASITELKARVSALEKATPAPVFSSSSQSSVYIPLGGGGGPWADRDWHSLSEYEILLDPSNYPGYTAMYLEVIFKMSEVVGTASIRLYNVTDSVVTSPQVDTTSSSYVLKTSSSFKLSSGVKTYRLQEKSTEEKDISIQSARIRVNF